MNNLRFRSLLLAVAAAGAAVLACGPAQAQQAPKPEQLIKWRQSAYQVVAWNSGRIKAALDGSFNKDEVVRAANAIAAIANAGLGALYAPGTDKGKGWRETTAKPEIWAPGSKIGEHAAAFSTEATELARVAGTGDAVLIKAQYGKLTRTCKACHDDFKNKD